MRRNWLITSLSVFLFFFVCLKVWANLGYPLSSWAQSPDSESVDTSVVGPHIAFFDSGNNQRLPGVLGEKTDKRLYTTVMVDVNADVSTITNIFQAANAHFVPIIRIVGVDGNTSADQATRIAQRLNDANINPTTWVVFGNEVNNLDKEWRICSSPCPDRTGDAAAAYGKLYQAFRDAAVDFRPLPAPLDIYNGIYTDWNGFVSKAVDSSGRSVYQGVDLAANAYDLGNPGDLTKYSQLPGNVVVLTEFGPNPSASLQEHLDFFQANPPPLPATTLIPDKCSSGGGEAWLYFVDGKIYDAQGTEVNPSTCDRRSNRGSPPEGDYYKRFVYPFYSSSANSQDLEERLQLSYSVTCSQITDYNTSFAGNLQELIEEQGQCDERLSNPTACRFSPEADLTLTSVGSTRIFGTMRNETEVKWRAYDYSQESNPLRRVFTNRFESVEQWFGANNPAEQPRASREEPVVPVDYINQAPNPITPLHDGPFYKLSTPLMQCVAATEVLTASKLLCDEWSGVPGNENLPCQLTARKVAGTDFTAGELYEEMFAAGGSSLASVCERAYGDGSASNPDATALRLGQAARNVDLYMETAYRPAFLVMVTEVSPDNQTTNQSNTGRTVTALDRKGSTGKHVVDYLVYHVPDSLTDGDPGDPLNSDTDPGDPINGQDIFTRTVNTFISTESQQKYNEAWDQYQRDIAEAEVGALPAVDCNGGVCDEPLREALINYINRYTSAYAEASCQNPTSGLQAEHGVKIATELEPKDTYDDLENAKNGEEITQGEARIRVNEYIGEDGQVVNRGDFNPPKTQIYNISPYGMKSNYVASSFEALFTKNQTDQEFTQDTGYYDTFEALFGTQFAASEDKREYQKCEIVEEFDPNTNQIRPVQKCETKSVADTVAEPNPPEVSAKFPWVAKVFNHSTRAIVQQISSAGQALLECARALPPSAYNRNTEEFLTKCQSFGVSIGERPQSPLITNWDSFVNWKSFKINYWQHQPNGNNQTLDPIQGPETDFKVPPSPVWEAAKEAAARHNGICDPMLLIAVASSESRDYTNDARSSVGARGVWQYTAETWIDIWKPIEFFNTPTFTKVTDTFICTNHLKEPECSPTNISAAADAACRHVVAIGLMKYPNDRASFIEAFAIPGNSHNQYGRTWNAHTPQADYAWRLWNKLRTLNTE